MFNIYKHTIIYFFIFSVFFGLNLQADIQQVKKIDNKYYDTIIKLIKIGCLNKAQELKVKLLADISSEQYLAKKEHSEKKISLEACKKKIVSIIMKQERINSNIMNYEQIFLYNIYGKNKADIEAVLNLPSGGNNTKTVIDEIGKSSTYSKKNKDCIYFPVTGNSKIDRNKIILAFIIKKILEKNNIKSEIIFTKGEKIKQITVVMPDFKKEIKYLDKEKMTVTIEKIMLIYYNKIIVKRDKERNVRRLSEDFQRDSRPE
jgi:hypothetical protein